MKCKQSHIVVHRYAGQKSLGILYYNGVSYPCALGRSGVGLKKCEGDGITPTGTFALRRLHVRADRVPSFKAGLPKRDIKPADWWCDDPNSRHYNLLMGKIVAPEGHEERLWRKDHLYDAIIEIGYNDMPVKKNKGSAIFIHAAREGMTPTAGCVALRRSDLIKLVRQLKKDIKIMCK